MPAGEMPYSYASTVAIRPDGFIAGAPGSRDGRALLRARSASAALPESAEIRVEHFEPGPREQMNKEPDCVREFIRADDGEAVSVALFPSGKSICGSSLRLRDDETLGLMLVLSVLHQFYGVRNVRTAVCRRYGDRRRIAACRYESSAEHNLSRMRKAYSAATRHGETFVQVFRASAAHLVVSSV